MPTYYDKFSSTTDANTQTEATIPKINTIVIGARTSIDDTVSCDWEWKTPCSDSTESFIRFDPAPSKIQSTKELIMALFENHNLKWQWLKKYVTRYLEKQAFTSMVDGDKPYADLFNRIDWIDIQVEIENHEIFLLLSKSARNYNYVAVSYTHLRAHET